MGDDPGTELYPEKDYSTKNPAKAMRNDSKEDDRNMYQFHERRVLSKWPRDELEDHYFRLYDENVILKKHARKQEDKIKRLATKLLRLLNDRKKQDQEKGIVGKKRDIETEQIIEEQQDKIREMGRQNKLLQEKLIVVRQQLDTQLKRPVPAIYRHVSPRVNSGIVKSSSKHGNVSQSPGGIINSPYSFYESGPYMNEKEDFIDETVSNLRDQLYTYEQEVLHLKEQLDVKETIHTEEMAALRSQLSQDQRQMLHGNISTIRLQRELKQKSSQLIAMQAQCADLEENLKLNHSDSDRLISSLEALNQQLKAEQDRNESLQIDVASLAESNLIVAECKEKIADLQKENKILRESNNKLMNNALDYESSRSLVGSPVLQRDAAIQAELSVMPTQFHRDSSFEEVSREKDFRLKAERELDQMRSSYDELCKRYDLLKEKLHSFAKDGGVAVTDFEKAMAYIQKYHEKALTSELLLGTSEDDSYGTLKKDFIKMQADHAETIRELAKTRDMLVTQNKLCQDYQKEVENATIKLSKLQQQHDIRLREQEHLLEQRAVRIKYLEERLKNILYGTTQNEQTSAENIANETGENIFEIHMHKVTFTKEGLELLGDLKPATFLSWGFYYFDVHSTSPVIGSNPEYNYTAQYVLNVYDDFLQYIESKRMTVELQQATSTGHSVVAAGQISFQYMLHKLENQGTVTLFGIRDDQIGVNFGTLEFWIRCRKPLKKHLVNIDFHRKEVIKSVSENVVLPSTNCKASNTSNENMNELNIKILRCEGIRSRIKGSQPSSYCMYKFYTKTDHDTAIIPFDSNPEFNDHLVLHLHQNSDLDQYLRTKVMEVFVFDDNDPELTSYLGLAQIPLLTLAHNKEIKGTFELKQANGHQNGTVYVALYWKSSYTPSDDLMEPFSVTNKSTNEFISKVEHDVGKHQPEESTTPKPKPRTLKINSSLNDSASSFLTKRPPVIPRETIKSIDAENDVSKSHKLPDKHINKKVSLEINSSSSASTSDEEENSDVVPGPSGYNQIQVENINNFSNGLTQTSEFDDKVTAVVEDSESYENESNDDSDGSEVPVVPDKMPPSNDVSLPSNTIMISVIHLSFLENAPFLDNDKIKMLFIEYRFLDYPPEELETPFSLPKPAANQSIKYNFTKEFNINASENAHRFKLFSNMIKNSNQDLRRVTFTVVSEPAEDNQVDDCEDLGFAYLDISKIVLEKRDIIDENIEVFDAKDSSQVIGYLNVTVKALAAINYLFGS